DYLFELGVNAASFGREEAADLSQFDLVVWYDNGNVGVSEREVALFEDLLLAAKPLYFIGDALFSSTGSSESIGSRWHELLHLRPKTVASAPSQIIIDTSIPPSGAGWVINDGIVGTVQDFAYPFSKQGGEQTGADGELVLGRAGGLDALVAFEDRREGGAARRLTQTFQVTGGSDERSNAERKKLFQNAVWWLLQFCICDNLNLRPDDRTATGPVEAGEDLTLTVDVSLAGGCVALSVAVAVALPPGVEFQNARSGRGDWNYANGVVTFHLGRLPRGAEETLEVIVRPTRSGSFTARCMVRSLNERSGSLPDNEIEIRIEVKSSQTLRMGISKSGSGPARITLLGPPGRTCLLEANDGLSGWSAVSTIELVNGLGEYADPQSTSLRQRIYRAKMK
ncbi:MAG: hypothetical protein L0Z50_34130, partial [Verrucomicrobiales bacterium]|nr:hypothetical protein [Verrucomicrobiales bacterium]